jgi:hypothetical protein
VVLLSWGEKVTYESIMKGSDFHEVFSNLIHMKNYTLQRGLNDFRLTLVFCAMRRTIEELPSYVDLAYSVGAKEIQVNYLQVTREGTGLESEAMCLHPELYDNMVLTAKTKAAKLGIQLMHQPLFAGGPASVDTIPCYRPWEHLIVSQNGSSAVCCGGCGTLSNMFEQGFPQTWNSPKLIEFRARVNSDNPPPGCRACTRGRENPTDVTTHITYLRDKGLEERELIIAELRHGAKEKQGPSVELIWAAKERHTPWSSQGSSSMGAIR